MLARERKRVSTPGGRAPPIRQIRGQPTRHQPFAQGWLADALMARGTAAAGPKQERPRAGTAR
jgi:hypothetical protein